MCGLGVPGGGRLGVEMLVMDSRLVTQPLTHQWMMGERGLQGVSQVGDSLVERLVASH